VVADAREVHLLPLLDQGDGDVALEDSLEFERPLSVAGPASRAWVSTAAAKGWRRGGVVASALLGVGLAAESPGARPGAELACCAAGAGATP
jgi:hypothetical protein